MNLCLKYASLQGAQGTPLQTQLVRAILTAACTNRQFIAGPGCPLPYNAYQRANYNAYQRANAPSARRRMK